MQNGILAIKTVHFFVNKKLETDVNDDGGNKDDGMVVGRLAAGDVEDKN